jgi:L-ascorbate metabolism protein UlaG (beta-lactamase superfamily)
MLLLPLQGDIEGGAMRGVTIVLSLLLWLPALSLPAQEGGDLMQVVDSIDWLGQAAVRISTGDRTVYIDPYKLKTGSAAELVLVTHCHQDHCSPDDLAKVVGDETVVVVPQDCLPMIEELAPKQTVSLQPGEEALFAGIKVEAVHAYNQVKTSFHPKKNLWVGYILTIDGIRVYHFGDTERIPEMKDHRCDIALVPLGQTYTMESVEDAADAVRDVKAKVAIPIHYGMYEGTEADANRLKELLAGEVEVVIRSSPTALGGELLNK